MAEAARKKDPQGNDDLAKYGKGAYVTTMRNWVKEHPVASPGEITKAFEKIIRAALKDGAKVSDHVRGTGFDIRVPADAKAAERLRQIIKDMGGKLKEEPDAAGGPHWHISMPIK